MFDWMCSPAPIKGEVMFSEVVKRNLLSHNRKPYIRKCENGKSFVLWNKQELSYSQGNILVKFLYDSTPIGELKVDIIDGDTLILEGFEGGLEVKVV